ncbi:helix-turn-helix domain-containing protein [Curvivirga aplysinae]|uniref:helix-turn-helix domain-containing protein n=1 Tax=Curvivirga aplysinae TaxID=2529852 RepID=UPI0012BBBCB0|nr:XRE family transcriptional regulator [Curvivirga aplysinae]MTI10677.1 XRE family transcriptional regulator [Curvivirga aplysinae]
MEPKIIIANAIKRERERAGLSLSALANKADLAKSTLSQVESGNCNPSIETLWAVATALSIPFSFLFEHSNPKHELIRANEGDEVSSKVAHFSAVLLDKAPINRMRDIYRIHAQKGEIRDATAHPTGTIEHALVASGCMRIGPSQMQEELNAGDYYRYPGDIAHSYECLSEEATLILIMDSNA